MPKQMVKITPEIQTSDSDDERDELNFKLTILKV